MSPQFVDFDADGTLDIVAGIFDGSPHVAFGDGKGWKQPQQILDKEGARIVMNQFWNFDTKKWDSTKRCNPEGLELPESHLTSAWAADCDGDGDLDLWLGDYDKGHVMWRINEGTRTQPAFATRNTPVMVGGLPLAVPGGKVATLRLVDWDGDGVQDLLVGSVGDSYGAGPGGGVFVYRNAGTDAAPKFGEATALIDPSTKGQKAPTRPDAGLYMDAMDHDGDGDLDLVVGGYSMWTPDAPVLDDGQKQRVAELQTQMAALDKEMQAFYQGLEQAVQGLDEAAANEKRTALLKEKRDELQAQSKRRMAIQQELEPLVPGQKRKSFVWLYENLAKGRAAAEASADK